MASKMCIRDSTLGDDLYGRSIQENLQKYGVDTRGVRTVPGCESFHAFILLNTQTASRTCVWSKGTVPPPTPEDVDVEQLAHARDVYKRQIFNFYSKLINND